MVPTELGWLSWPGDYNHKDSPLSFRRPHRMTLRTFSWVTVVVGVAVAAVGWFGIAGTLAIVVVAACVAAHVAGNAIGTSMRDATDRDVATRPRRTVHLPPQQTPTLLERGESLGRLVPVSAGIGGVAGAAIGTTCLIVFVGSSWPGAALGGVSSGVIGGIGGFLLASFVDVIRSAFREADEREQLHRQRHPAEG